MTLQPDGTYAITYKNVPATQSILFKICENHGWDVSYGTAAGANVEFKVTAPCDVTITFNPETKEIKVIGDSAQMITEFVVDYIEVVGSSQGGFEVTWDPGTSVKMTKTQDKVWSVTFEELDNNTEYTFKFAANGSWANNWGVAKDGTTEVKLDEAVAATFDGDNIKFTVVADPALAETSDVTLTLDLTNYDSTAHTGAVFTISPQLNAN